MTMNTQFERALGDVPDRGDHFAVGDCVERVCFSPVARYRPGK